MDTPTPSARVSAAQMRRQVAERLLQEAGTLLEFWTEKTEGTDAEGIPHEFAQMVIAKWLARLPGDAWDTRLGEYPG
jgi:hypothetical protein